MGWSLVPVLSQQPGLFTSDTYFQRPPANAGDKEDSGSILRLGRVSGGGKGNPIEYSCLGNPMGREAWWVTVQGATKSQTQLSN